MKFRQLNLFIVLSIIVSCASVSKQIANASFRDDSCLCKSKLGKPFGTICELKVEIIDGDDLPMKAYWGVYLMRIIEIDKRRINDSIMLTFEDKTGKFPAELFGLYKHLYGKETGTIDAYQKEKMEKNYVGEKYLIVAYESGGFDGIPDKYFNYQPIETSLGFYFKNYLVVVSDSK